MTRFQRRPKNKFAILILIFFALAGKAFCEKITDNDYKFSLDVPEGYKISDYTKDGLSYVFSHDNIPVTLIMKIINDNSETEGSKILQKNLSKLNAQGQTASFNWSEKSCGISNFSMTLDTSYTGWAVCAPLLIKNNFVLLLCYAPTEKQGCDQFIISTINSLCIDEKYKNTPGIITSYAFPKEGTKNIELNIGGKKITTSIDKSDIEAAKFTVDLEYSVLTLYANHKMWKEAWQRYYRMIYRDNAGRLEKASFDIFNALYASCKAENPNNPDITYAQKLLSWVQNFSYKRAASKSESDFTSIPEVLCGQGNDCDSRSMLLSILLNSKGIDTAMLISREYSHAVAITQINAPGQKYLMESNKKEYLFGETTAKVTWGMIAQEHADRKKWIPVSFTE
ncbi:MAG: hypothetical protein J6X84_05585 [Treponema sp.]|nr:hypothetical protein [Treponema sp.]